MRSVRSRMVAFLTERGPYVSATGRFYPSSYLLSMSFPCHRLWICVWCARKNPPSHPERWISTWPKSNSQPRRTRTSRNHGSPPGTGDSTQCNFQIPWLTSSGFFKINTNDTSTVTQLHRNTHYRSYFASSTHFSDRIATEHSPLNNDTVRHHWSRSPLSQAGLLRNNSLWQQIGKNRLER